ncbi:MAG: DUF3084 domain-containing protein [bacterium]
MNDFISSLLKILFFFIVGSLISFVADNIGKKIGKKKIVLFNIRPRYTAMFITSITGGIIAVSSIIFLSFLSQDAKIYLFQMNQIVKQMDFYKNEVKILQDRYTELSKDISVLIQTTHMGDIVFVKNQPLYIYSFFNDGNIKHLYDAIEETERIVKNRYKVHINSSEIYLPKILRISDDDIKKVYEQMKNRRGKRLALIFISKRNTFLGEYADVGIYQIEDKLLVPKGTVLGEVYVEEPSETDKNFALIMNAISEIQEKLLKEGKLFLPQENSIGGEIPLEKIVNELIKMKEIHNLTKNKKKFKILLINEDDIYLAGKFKITLQVTRE